MNVHVAIDRLILDGVDVRHAHRPTLAAAVEGELARLIAEGGLPPDWSGAVPNLPADGLVLPPGEAPQLLGARIARAVYGGSER